MANMSYCRFENTLRDLQDCDEYIYDELSESEHRYRAYLIRLCAEIASAAGDDEYLLNPNKSEDEQ